MKFKKKQNMSDFNVNRIYLYDLKITFDYHLQVDKHLLVVYYCISNNVV